MKVYKTIFAEFPKKNILVVGDVILDKYITGSVSRISPEAPVPIVLEKGSFCTPGGAANVANNLRGMGAKVTLVGVVGDDVEGKILLEQLKKEGADTQGIFVVPKMPTIYKTRVIVQHQQVVRIDRENTVMDTDLKTHDKICRFIGKNIARFDAIIISDYGKGLIRPELVSFVCAQALSKKKIVTVDPQVKHFEYYRHVTAITPNLSEVENAIRNIKITSKSSEKLNIHTDKLEKDKDINSARTKLLNYLGLDTLLITLGEKGMRLFEKGKKPVVIKTTAREVYDVSGAGDTVISVFTLSLAAGATKHQAAELANYAGGIVVGKMGAIAVTKKELESAIKGR